MTLTALHLDYSLLGSRSGAMHCVGYRPQSPVTGMWPLRVDGRPLGEWARLRRRSAITPVKSRSRQLEVIKDISADSGPPGAGR